MFGLATGATRKMKFVEHVRWKHILFCYFYGTENVLESSPSLFNTSTCISALMSQVSQRITDNKNGDKLVDGYD